MEMSKINSANQQSLHRQLHANSPQQHNITRQRSSTIISRINAALLEILKLNYFLCAQLLSFGLKLGTEDLADSLSTCRNLPMAILHTRNVRSGSTLLLLLHTRIIFSRSIWIRIFRLFYVAHSTPHDPIRSQCESEGFTVYLLLFRQWILCGVRRGRTINAGIDK